LDFQLEGIIEITWWFLGISYVYPQLGIKKMIGGHQPVFGILGFFIYRKCLVVAKCFLQFLVEKTLGGCQTFSMIFDPKSP
jgi:uncharacterized membrane protein YkvI